MSKRLLLMLMAVLVVSPQLVQAETSSGSEVKNHVEARLADRMARQEELKNKVEERKDKLASRAAAVKSRIQERRDEFEKRREELASKAAEMRERMKERRLEFKKKLSELKDDKKASIAARVDANIDRLNKNHTDRLANVLEKLNDIVGRLEDKVASASALGKDTASASAAISTAKNKIAQAQTAVSEQSGKDYAPVITDETTFGAVISKAFTTFMKDIQVVQALVVDAKQAVKTAAQSVMLLK